MTPEEQRIALAEACPTVFVRPLGHASWNYRHPNGRILPCIDGDPLKSLEAMHEAEKILFPVGFWQGPDRFSEYCARLERICIGHPGGTLRATAAQRAEALLATLQKIPCKV